LGRRAQGEAGGKRGRDRGRAVVRAAVAGGRRRADRWARVLSESVTRCGERAERGVRRRQVGPAAQVGRVRGAGGVAVERACWAGVRRVRERAVRRRG